MEKLINVDLISLDDLEEMLKIIKNKKTPRKDDVKITNSIELSPS
jgi:hypothetical protein